MGYTIEIGPDSDLVALDANVNFRPSVELTPAQNNTGERIDIRIQAGGRALGASASAIKDKIVSFWEEVHSNVTARRVRVLLDGTAIPELTWNPTDCIVGPLVTFFEFDTADEGGESHLSWVMSIIAVRSGREGSENEDTLSLKTSLAVKTVNGEVVRKIWRADAQSRTAEAAETAVKSYQPSEEKVTSELTTHFQDARATGVWIWESRKPNGIIDIVERIGYFDGGRGYEIQTRVGDPGGTPQLAVAYEKPLMASHIIVEVTIRSFDPKVAPLAPHFKDDGESLLYDESKSRRGTAAPADDFLKTGIWILSYTEFYWNLGVGDPEPDHSDHAEFEVLEPPEGGIIATEP